MASIKPILNFTSPIRVSNIDDTKVGRLLVEYNGELVDVLSGSASRVLDIIELNHVLISPTAFNEWLVQSDFGQILNRWVVDNYEILTISANDTEYGFLLSTDDRVVTLFVDHTHLAQSMMSKLSALGTMINRIEVKLEKILDKYDDEDPFIQLIEDNHISDYVSFEHLVKSTNEFEEVRIFIEDLYKDTSQLYFMDDSGIYPSSMEPNTDINIKYEYCQLNPIYNRIVREGDIIDLTLGYRVIEDSSAGEELLKYEFDEKYSSVLPSDGVTLGVNQMSYEDESNEMIYDHDEVLPKLYYGTDENFTEIIYNGFTLVRGRTRATSVTTLVKVGQLTDEDGSITPIIQQIGDDFILEITNDRLVVYSINPRITEYIIKSCRKINLPTEDPTDTPTEIPTEDPTDTPTPPYVVPDLDDLGLTAGYPDEQGQYFYELSGVRPIRIYEAYSDCGKHFICYWDDDYIIEMGDDYMILPFRVVDFFNREDKILNYLTHDDNGYSGYSIIGKDTFQLDNTDGSVWQFRGNEEGHWELITRLKLSSRIPTGVMHNPDVDQFNQFIRRGSSIQRYKLVFRNGVDPTDGYEYLFMESIDIRSKVAKEDLGSIKSPGDYAIIGDRYYLGASLSDDTIDTRDNKLFRKFGILSTTYKYPAFK